MKEVEVKARLRDSQEIQEQLLVFLETLGVSRSDQVLEGYDTQVYNKFHVKRETSGT